jgi:hypothetical protein
MTFRQPRASVSARIVLLKPITISAPVNAAVVRKHGSTAMKTMNQIFSGAEIIQPMMVVNGNRMIPKFATYFPI